MSDDYGKRYEEKMNPIDRLAGDLMMAAIDEIAVMFEMNYIYLIAVMGHYMGERMACVESHAKDSPEVMTKMFRAGTEQHVMDKAFARDMFMMNFDKAYEEHLAYHVRKRTNTMTKADSQLKDVLDAFSKGGKRGG